MGMPTLAIVSLNIFAVIGQKLHAGHAVRLSERKPVASQTDMGFVGEQHTSTQARYLF